MSNAFWSNYVLNTKIAHWAVFCYSIFMNKTIFITGVSGVGKTTIIDELKPLLDSSFQIHDFDERGVPDNVDRQWRLDETQHWLELGKQNGENGLTTIICGFSSPKEIGNQENVKLILLDADELTIRQRLNKRYQVPGSVEGLERTAAKPLEQFIDENINYASVIRSEAQEYGVDIIDTSEKTPDQVAKQIISTIYSYYA